MKKRMLMMNKPIQRMKKRPFNDEKTHTSGQEIHANDKEIDADSQETHVSTQLMTSNVQ